MNVEMSRSISEHCLAEFHFKAMIKFDICRRMRQLIACETQVVNLRSRATGIKCAVAWINFGSIGDE